LSIAYLYISTHKTLHFHTGSKDLCTILYKKLYL